VERRGLMKCPAPHTSHCGSRQFFSSGHGPPVVSAIAFSTQRAASASKREQRKVPVTPAQDASFDVRDFAVCGRHEVPGSSPREPIPPLSASGCIRMALHRYERSGHSWPTLSRVASAPSPRPPSLLTLRLRPRLSLWRCAQLH
jgi:hypothetical protein